MYENLKEFRKEKGLTQAQMAQSIGMATNTYSNYEKRVREPTSDFWIALAEKYDVSVDYLIGFTDDPKRSKFATPSKLDQKYAALDEHGRKVVDAVIDLETERVKTKKAETKTVVVDLGTIRRYLSHPAAGPGGMVEGEDFEDIPRTPDMPEGADFCVIVSGDSMEPVINDGQTVYVSESAELHEFDVGVWYVDGATYVKQYAPQKDGSLQLLSANPDREDKNLTIKPTGNQSVQYFGKVLGLGKLTRPKYNGDM